jgi:hypothetical protein
MDLEAVRSALLKRSTFSAKRVAFFGVVALCVVAGIFLRSGLYSAQPEAEQNTPATSTPTTTTPAVEATKSVAQPDGEQNAPVAATPSPSPATVTSAGEGIGAVQSSPPSQNNAVTAATEQVEPAVNPPDPAGAADEHAEPALPGSGIILVARLPVEVRASPSSSAPALYGFPAGRPFRVIGREGGFAHIQDLKSSASGWIDEAALAQPPDDPTASVPAQPKSYSAGGKPTNSSAGPKPKTTQKDPGVTADSEAAAQPGRNRPGIFGRGGLFGGIFGN